MFFCDYDDTYVNPYSTLARVFILDITFEKIVPGQIITGFVKIQFESENYYFKFHFSYDLKKSFFQVVYSNEKNPKFVEYKDSIIKLLTDIIGLRLNCLLTPESYPIYTNYDEVMNGEEES